MLFLDGLISIRLRIDNNRRMCMVKKNIMIMLSIILGGIILFIGDFEVQAAKEETYFMNGKICYRILDENEVCAVGAKVVEGTLTIPAYVTYKGKTYVVTEIADCKIYYEMDANSEKESDGENVCLDFPRMSSYQLEEWIFGPGVEDVYGFGGNTMDKVVLPGTLTYIGEGSFCGCPNLKEVVFARKYKKLTVGINAFSAPKLKNITFPEGTYELKANAAGCTESIYIPASVKKIGNGVVNSNTKKVAISRKNNKFKMKNGILYTKDEKQLLGASAKVKGKVVISKKTKTIAKNAFANTNVKEVVLNKKITEVPKGAFAYCKKLKKVSGTQNVKAIEYAAFAGCGKLRSIGEVSKLTSIKRAAFWGADKLSIKLSARIKNIDTYAFSGTLVPTEVNVTIAQDNPTFFINNGFLIKREEDKQTVLLQIVDLMEEERIVVPEQVTDIPVAIRRKGRKEMVFPTTLKYHDAAVWGEGGTVIYLAVTVPEFGNDYGIGAINATMLDSDIESKYSKEFGSDKYITLIVPKGSLIQYKEAIEKVYSEREEDNVWKEDGMYVTLIEQ